MVEGQFCALGSFVGTNGAASGRSREKAPEGAAGTGLGGTGSENETVGGAEVVRRRTCGEGGLEGGDAGDEGGGGDDGGDKVVVSEFWGNRTPLESCSSSSASDGRSFGLITTFGRGATGGFSMIQRLMSWQSSDKTETNPMAKLWRNQTK